MSTRFPAFFRAVSGATAAMVLGVALAGPALAGPAATAARPVHAIAPVAGTITVVLDPGTLTATPSHEGARCLFRVEAVLELDGTVDGTATGTTRALVHAPCAEATSNPPGTFADTFAFTGDFLGTVSEAGTAAEVRYAGGTRAGGGVSAVLVLDGGAVVVAAVQARAAEGGTYRGVAATP
jgi:hypothetical protein